MRRYVAVTALALAAAGAPGVGGAAQKPLTAEEKVRASDYVVSGRVIRIICVERDAAGRTVDIEGARCAGDWKQGTHWVIHVSRLLCRKADLPDPLVLLRAEPGTGLATVREQTEHYLGKEAFFFLRRMPAASGIDPEALPLRFARSGDRDAFPQPASMFRALTTAVDRHCPDTIRRK